MRSVDAAAPVNPQGKRNGHGRYTYPQGGYYEGEWQGSKYHGQGSHVDAQGRKYVGSFKDGKKHGEREQTTRMEQLGRRWTALSGWA